MLLGHREHPLEKPHVQGCETLSTYRIHGNKNSKLWRQNVEVENTFLTKEQDKVPELSEVEISNLPKKQFKVMIVRCSKNLGKDWMNRVRSLKFLTRSLRKYIKNQLEEKKELRCKCLRNNQD